MPSNNYDIFSGYPHVCCWLQGHLGSSLFTPSCFMGLGAESGGGPNTGHHVPRPQSPHMTSRRLEPLPHSPAWRPDVYPESLSCSSSLGLEDRLGHRSPGLRISLAFAWSGSAKLRFSPILEVPWSLRCPLVFAAPSPQA